MVSRNGPGSPKASAAPRNLAFAKIITGLREEYLASQDAILDLGRFAIAQASSLDAEEGAIRDLAARFLPEGSNDDVKRAFYQAASDFRVRIQEIVEDTSELEGAAQAEIRDRRLEEAESKLKADLEPIRIGAYLPGLLFQKFMAVQARKKRAPVMLESLLVMGVSNFENFVSKLATTSLAYNDGPMKSSNRKYSYAEVVELGGATNEFRARVIDDYVTELMRGGLSEWLGFVATAVRMPESAREQMHDELVEVVQRRHVLVHNGGRVSALYNRNSGARTVEVSIGERLGVNAGYLENAVERLSLAGIVLAQGALSAVCAKGARGDEDINATWGSVNEVLFEMMIARRWYCPGRSFELIKDMLPNSEYRTLVMVNSWYSTLKTSPQDAVLQRARDWDVSSLHPKFKLARSCILGEASVASGLAEELLASGELSQMNIDTWPILECVRVYREEMGRRGEIER